MKYIDCHSHLSFLKENELNEVIVEGKKENIKSWVMGGYNLEDWNRQLKVKKEYPSSIYTCLGLHPWEVVKLSKKEINLQLESLSDMLDHADFLGETGLDFFMENGRLESAKQKEVFEQHLSLSSTKPFVLHIVQAHGAALEILKNYSPKGFVHSFSGSYEVAKGYIDQGLLLSFSSNICSGKFSKARESLMKIPIESILIESDSPSGSNNLSSPVKTFFDTAQEVAKLRGIELESLLDQVTKNFESLSGNYDRPGIL